MERDTEIRQQLIDLGTATVETKGAEGNRTDDVLKRPFIGLSDD